MAVAGQVAGEIASGIVGVGTEMVAGLFKKDSDDQITLADKNSNQVIVVDTQSDYTKAINSIRGTKAYIRNETDPIHIETENNGLTDSTKK